MVKELFSKLCERFHLYERLPADEETGGEQDGGECSEDQSRDKISSSNAFWNICNSIQGTNYKKFVEEIFFIWANPSNP